MSTEPKPQRRSALTVQGWLNLVLAVMGWWCWAAR